MKVHRMLRFRVRLRTLMSWVVVVAFILGCYAYNVRMELERKADYYKSQAQTHAASAAFERTLQKTFRSKQAGAGNAISIKQEEELAKKYIDASKNPAAKNDLNAAEVRLIQQHLLESRREIRRLQQADRK